MGLRGNVLSGLEELVDYLVNVEGLGLRGFLGSHLLNI